MLLVITKRKCFDTQSSLAKSREEHLVSGQNLRSRQWPQIKATLKYTDLTWGVQLTKVIRVKCISKQIVAFSQGGGVVINRHVVWKPLEQCRTITSECYTTICLPYQFQEKNNKTALQDCSLKWYYEISHTRRSNSLLYRSEHRIDWSSAV